MRQKILIRMLLILFIDILIFTSYISGINQAYEDDIASVYLYFTWMEEDGSWHEWSDVTDEHYTDLNLLVNQTIKCRLVITPFKKTALSFRIHEPGTNTFEVLEGNQHDKSVFHSSVEPNATIEYTWVLRTTNRWVGGRAPVNVYWQVSTFKVNEQGVAEVVDTISKEQSFANPFIENEEWTGPSYTPDNGNNGNGDSNSNENNNNDENTPGFELAVLLMALAAVVIFSRKTKKKL